jgi:hypothetical protein
MATKLTIPAGTTYTKVVRWASDVVAYKAISGISKTAPVVVTAPSHGLKTGWPVAVESVKAMTQINAQNSPPRESDLHAVTSTGADTLTLDGVNSIGYSTYTGGGALRYNVPESLAAATARMHLVDRWRPLSAGISFPHEESTAYVVGDIVHVDVGTHYQCSGSGTSDSTRPGDLLTGDGTVTWALLDSFIGSTVYVALTSSAGIALNDTEHTITWTLADTETSHGQWESCVAQLEVVVGGVVSRVADYEISLSRETTR